MPIKHDDATTGEKLLRLFQRLMLDGRRHFQQDLAEWLNCSPQTVIRLTAEVEGVIGTRLQMGIEGRRRWYQIAPLSRRDLGLDYAELRYLRLCRELAEPYLPQQIKTSVDESIFRFSMLMADSSVFPSEKERNFSFFSKGRIDYTGHFEHIDLLMQAMENRRVCLVRYRALGRKKSSEHRFAVGRMVSMNNALYALGAGVDEDFAAMTHPTNLAVHRIIDVVLTSKPVTFDLPEADPGAFGLPWHEPCTYRIKFAPGKPSDYVRERIWAETQTMETAPDGGAVLTVTTRSKPELLAWVRSFGEDAQLLDSPSDPQA